MKVGLIGYAQTGKSTLFQALTGVTPDPSQVMKGHTAIASVVDPRLDFLSQMYQPKKHTPATVEFVDTPGLLLGESKDNAQRIATLRSADGLAVILGAFSRAQTPADEYQAFQDEMLISDLMVVENRLSRLKEQMDKGRFSQNYALQDKERANLGQLQAQLEKGAPLTELDLTEEALIKLKGFNLFSFKPQLIVVNCGEGELDSISKDPLAKDKNTLYLSAKLERDLEELSEEDRSQFMEELGVTELARPQLIAKAYEAIDLISFFTVGEDECRAWTIGRGETAVEAASAIHSDISKGFICAEVTRYEDLATLGSMKEVKAHGKQQLQGKEYIVQDGDIISYRFNV